MIAALLAGILGLSASAQNEYIIQVHGSYNLRSQPNTNSTIVGSVRANDKLTVVGEENGWLEVLWEANIITAWMAGWLDYTVLQQPPDLTGQYDDFNPYVLFPNCDPAEFREYAIPLLDHYVHLMDFMHVNNQSSIYSRGRYILYGGGRDVIHYGNLQPILPCREAIELQFLTQQIFTDWYILGLMAGGLHIDTAEEVVKPIGDNHERLVELTPFYRNHVFYALDN